MTQDAIEQATLAELKARTELWSELTKAVKALTAMAAEAWKESRRG